MGTIASAATTKVLEMLAAPSGLALELGKIAESEGAALTPIDVSQMLNQQIGFELAEKTAGAAYPSIYVYCEKLENSLREKFRRFSGRAHLAIELRLSHERLETLTREVEMCAGAVTAALDAHRGTWDPGYFYTGGYTVEFGPVKRGGKNFIQVAKVTLAVEVSLG